MPTLRVFVAGATGAIGRPLVARLRAHGYQAVGSTRNEGSANALLELGVEAVVMDALDPDSVQHAMRIARPEIVIDQLTALPRWCTPAATRAALEETNRVRVEGGANLHPATERSGVRRYLVQSGAYYYRPGPSPASEAEPFVRDAPPLVAGGGRVFAKIERCVLSSDAVEGIALSYGFFYGPGTWYTRTGDVAHQVRAGQFPITGDGEGVWSFVHIDDAVTATIAAGTIGEPGVYNITDDDHAPLATWLPAFAAWGQAPPPPTVPVGPDTAPNARYYTTRLRGTSNLKAKRALAFEPRPREWLHRSDLRPEKEFF